MGADGHRCSPCHYARITSVVMVTMIGWWPWLTVDGLHHSVTIPRDTPVPWSPCVTIPGEGDHGNPRLDRLTCGNSDADPTAI
jgi:hypothetical protein